MVLFQGLENEYQEEGQLLGRFTYDQEGESLQMFVAPVRPCVSCTFRGPLPQSQPRDPQILTELPTGREGRPLTSGPELPSFSVPE